MNKKLLPAMKLASGLLVISLELGLMLVSSQAVAQRYWANEEPMSGRGRFPRFDLAFSIAEGGYIPYNCDPNYDYYNCDSFIAPFNFEFLGGFRLTRFLSLDLALNFSLDSYGYRYYNNGANYEVFVWTSIRPGIRLFLPTYSHEQVYFRVAFPLTFRVNQENEDHAFVPGFLFGVGVEWLFRDFGFFLEGDIIPYFYKIYPHFYIIPIEGRLGIVAHF